MLLIIHITVALLSLFIVGLSYFYPSKAKINASIILTATTFISGSYLIISSASHIVQSCIIGLIYLVGVVATIFVTSQNLAKKATQ